ncbi:MAG: response regulator [Burkholderiaceae bacterium]|nr:response regulator [Burkholderiaceae bacterium]
MSVNNIRFANWIWGGAPQGRPLRKTLLLLTLLPLFPALLALGSTLTRYAHQTIEASEGEKLSAQARTVAEMIDTEIGHRLNDLRSRAALLATLGLHQQPDRLSTWIDTIQEHIQEYTWIGFADPSGRVQAANRGLLKGQSVEHREWFMRGRKQPTTIDLHSAVMLSELLGPAPGGGPWRFIDLATPVMDPSGRLLGVMGVHLSWDWLLTQHKRLLQSIPKHLRAEIVVLGEDGKIRLTSPAPETQALGHLDSFQRARAGERGWMRERWPDGQDYLVGYHRNPGFGNVHQLGWVTLICLPIDAVDDQIQPVIIGIWLMLAAALALFLAAMALLLNLTLNSTEQIAQEIEGVAREGGRLDIQRPAPREFRVLADTTNQMIQSLEAQRTADQNKSRFIADISHEIRTPLNGMIGLTELLRHRGGPPEADQDIDAITRCGKELNQLLSDVIDFSAIEEHRLRFELQPTAIRELIEHNTQLFRGLAVKKGIQLKLSQDIPDNLWLLLDPLRVGQIIKNFISNAVKFTASGSVEIRSRIISGSGLPNMPITRLQIDIEDTGIGLTQDQQEIVFGRFQQAGSSISHRYGGSGLGLTLARSLIQAMGGQLSLYSTPDQGSCFSFWLPAQQTTEPAVDRTASHGHKHPPLSPMRVLVVDDVPINREILVRWLTYHGHHVFQADTGEAAVQQCQSQQLDLILIDIDLPGISGREAAHRIRHSAGPCAESVIIAISGHAFAQDIEASLAAGIDLHLSKPVDFHALPALIQKCRESRARGDRNTLRS